MNEIESLRLENAVLRAANEETRGVNARAEAEAIRLEAVVLKLIDALKTLRTDANRLCDRMLGGTYEADCRRAIAEAGQALEEAKPRRAPGARLQ